MKVIDFIKYLFKELFEVNHLMLDMINELENMDCGKDFLINFYLKNIQKEYSKDDLITHRNEIGYSVLNNLSDDEFNAFLNSIYKW